MHGGMDGRARLGRAVFEWVYIIRSIPIRAYIVRLIRAAKSFVRFPKYYSGQETASIAEILSCIHLRQLLRASARSFFV